MPKDASEMTATKSFETETCSRCGGSGSYSYCQMYGHTCFKCSGRGKVYTKRAMAALAYARQLRTVSVTELQVGWLLYVDAPPTGGKSGWLPIISAGFGESRYGITNPDGTQRWLPYFEITTEGGGGLGTFPDGKVQAVPNKARLAEIRELALQYQDTLTQKGTPKRRRAA